MQGAGGRRTLKPKGPWPAQPAWSHWMAHSQEGSQKRSA
jgi:hypothetical protein